MSHKASIITLIFIFALYLNNIVYVNAAQIINKEQILFSGQNLDIGFMGYRYSGPYYVESDKTIYVEWTADRLVSFIYLTRLTGEIGQDMAGHPATGL
ncbi:MAG: hypothetical protein QXQ94_10755 [Candidatus Bathyarchaeia archaeon]